MTKAGTQPYQQTEEADKTIYNELTLSLDRFGLPSWALPTLHTVSGALPKGPCCLPENPDAGIHVLFCPLLCDCTLWLSGPWMFMDARYNPGPCWRSSSGSVFSHRCVPSCQNCLCLQSPWRSENLFSSIKRSIWSSSSALGLPLYLQSWVLHKNQGRWKAGMNIPHVVSDLLWNWRLLSFIPSQTRILTRIHTCFAAYVWVKLLVLNGYIFGFERKLKLRKSLFKEIYQHLSVNVTIDLNIVCTQYVWKVQL